MTRGFAEHDSVEWSPDGRWLAIIQQGQPLSIVNRRVRCGRSPHRAAADSTASLRVRAALADGSGADTLFSAPWSDFEAVAPYGVFDPTCAWARGGDAVLFLAANPDRLVLSTLADGSTSTVVQLPERSTFIAGSHVSFLESPDGARVAYAARIGDSKVLGTVDLDGQNQREWASVPDGHEALGWFWEASGRYAFLRFDIDNRTEVRSVDTVTGEDFPLTVDWRGTNLTGVGFSPDASRVVFQKTTVQNLETFDIRLEYVATKPDGSDEVVMPSGVSAT